VMRRQAAGGRRQAAVHNDLSVQSQLPTGMHAQ
jgi:hypothetical protein